MTPAIIAVSIIAASIVGWKASLRNTREQSKAETEGRLEALGVQAGSLTKKEKMDAENERLAGEALGVDPKEWRSFWDKWYLGRMQEEDVFIHIDESSGVLRVAILGKTWDSMTRSDQEKLSSYGSIHGGRLWRVEVWAERGKTPAYQPKSDTRYKVAEYAKASGIVRK